MTDANQNLFWERLPEEPDVAFAAFAVYRDMGITRSLREAAKAYYSQRNGYQEATAEELPNTSQVQRFKAWSRAWMWVARCEAHDLEEDREWRLRLHERRIRTSDYHWKVGQLAMQRCAERLQNLGAWDEPPLPLRSLAPLLNAASQLQRLALGETTADIHVRGPARPYEEDAALDVSKLSLEDKEELVRIAGYLDDDGGLPDHSAPPESRLRE